MQGLVVRIGPAVLASQGRSQATVEKHQGLADFHTPVGGNLLDSLLGACIVLFLKLVLVARVGMLAAFLFHQQLPRVTHPNPPTTSAAMPRKAISAAELTPQPGHNSFSPFRPLFQTLSPGPAM